MIVVQHDPAGGRELLHAALQDEAGREVGADLTAGWPLPLYRLTANAASKPRPLSSARKVGWRYPLLRGEARGFACLLVRAKRPVFAGVNWHVFAQRLFAAAKLAEESLSSAGIKYEPRLLEIPALRMFVLWLFARGGKSRFFVLKMLYSDGDGSLMLESDFQQRYREAISNLQSNSQSADETSQRN